MTIKIKNAFGRVFSDFTFLLFFVSGVLL